MLRTKVCADPHHDGSKDVLLTAFSPNGDGTYRSRCRVCEARRKRERRVAGATPRAPIGDDEVTTPDARVAPLLAKRDPGPQPLRQALPEARVYVVTYAQNATPVNEEFLASLLVYCEARDAELIIIPGRYKNPTSIWSQHMEHDEWWDDLTHPYLYAGRKTLGDHITIYGDISIQPTATRPLTGFEVFAGAHSAVFGHPKVQLKTVATAKRYYPRILTTTGAITEPNYTDSKAGKKGDAHHTYGAVVVEQGPEVFHIRQVTAAADGSFIDLETKYTPEGPTPAGRALALVCGDIHVERSDPDVLAATFDRPDSIVATLRPETIVYHDVLDFQVRNHHTIKDFTDRYARATGAKHDSVETEVKDAVRFLDERTPLDAQAVVVASNHDEAFDRWLAESDPKHDPVNARFFHETWVRKIARFDVDREWVPAFELLYAELGAGRARFLRRDEPFRVADIDCNYHGDKGLNGARGSIFTYAQLGIRTISGHSHTPAILDFAVRVGVTASLDHEYNFTPSSWLNSHAVVYADASVSLLHVIGPSWRGKA